MLSGTFSEEIEVKANAAEFWKVYGNPKLVSGLLVEKLPDLFRKIEVIEGDGGTGTVLKYTFAPGDLEVPAGITYQIQKYTVVDNEKRVKLVEVVEGEMLALMGFMQLRIRSQVWEKDENSSIVKISMEYEIKEEEADKLAFLSVKPFVAIINVISDTLNKTN